MICAGWGCSTRVDEGEDDAAFFPREPSLSLGVDGEEVVDVTWVVAEEVDGTLWLLVDVPLVDAVEVEEVRFVDAGEPLEVEGLRTRLLSPPVVPALVPTRLLPPVVFEDWLALEPLGMRFTTLSCKRTNDSAP